MANRHSRFLIRTLPLAALAAALTACQPQLPATQDAAVADAAAAPEAGEGMAPGERINYQCAEVALGASFDDQGQTVRLSYSGQRLELPIATSASGARYADDDGNEFWGKGMDEARLSLAGEEPRDCVRSDRTSPWEQAAERGVTFRAIGQEPGWLVEVSDGDADASLSAHLDYGERVLDVTGLESDEAGVYSGSTADGTRVTLTISERECSDVMSGERFRAAASLVAGDRQYEGCGAWLSAD